MLTIEILENVDATGFRIYDLTTWAGGFAHTNVTAMSLEVEYDGNTYTYDPVGASMMVDIGQDIPFINLFGNALSSYFEITPDRLMDGTTALNTTYFPDGYYEITLYVTYTGEGDIDDYSHQGFMAESYMMASKLPLTIDMNDFDYEENRLQFLCIALLNSAVWAAELGRPTEFAEITEKINDFLDARSINEIWST
jgi:hypothetical protein